MKRFQAVTFALLLCTVKIRATLHDLHDIVDLSNGDLVNFQYFKNLPSQNPRTAAQYSPFIEHFQKKKAILDYVEHLFFGNSVFTQESEIPFNPYAGRAWRSQYQRKYGYRGEHLINALGAGYSLRQLRLFGAIPKEFGTRYYPS